MILAVSACSGTIASFVDMVAHPVKVTAVAKAAIKRRENLMDEYPYFDCIWKLDQN
jgi:hypothetical protein